MKTRRHSAFSLIELLTVVGIVAVLAALVTPAVSAVRNKGKDTKCLSNLRQWGIALNSYLADSQGRLPADGNEDSPSWANVASVANTNAWYNILPPYVGIAPLKDFTAAERALLYTGQKASIFQCPRATWAGNERTASGPIFSYAFNSKIFTGDSPTVLISQLTDQGVNNANNRQIAPSVIPMIVDTRASTKEPKAVTGMNNEYGTAKSYTRRLSNRHSAANTTKGTINIVFFDGSVRSFRASEIMDSSGRNIATSPIVWEPTAPDNP